jgi:uncharacterized damage-inducible protein DinB
MRAEDAMTRTLAALLCLAIPAVAAAQNPVSDTIRDAWNGARGNLVRAGEAMPDAKFSFKPIDTVRSYGQILAHVAGANYVFCAAARGEKAPYAEDHFEKSATTKAAIMKALADANAYCDAAYKALTDKTAGEMVASAFGNGKAARASALLGNTGHHQEHYGNLVTYLRLNGIVPPSSAGQ